MVSVLALAKNAARSAGLIPASSCSVLIKEGRLLSRFNSWITVGANGGSRAWMWSVRSERMMRGSMVRGGVDGMVLMMRLRIII